MPTAAYTITRTTWSDLAIATQVNAEIERLRNGRLDLFAAGGTANAPTGARLISYSLSADPFYPPNDQGVATQKGSISGIGEANGVPVFHQIFTSSGELYSAGTVAAQDNQPIQQGTAYTLENLQIIF